MNKTAKKNYGVKNFAQLKANIFALALFICANTNSCGMVFQPKMPSEVAKYSKIK